MNVSQDVGVLITIVLPVIIYSLLFFYSWKSISREVKETGRQFTRLQFAGKILSINFLTAFCIFVFVAIYTYVTTIGSEYGGKFAVMLLIYFAFFVYIMQAAIIFIVTLLVFPFVKSKLATIRANSQLNPINFAQPTQSHFISQATKILIAIFVVIGIAVYFLFFS